MLLALSVQDFVIVDHARIEFAPGFSVLTGETGAGKSILVDALLIVLGGRAESGVVRAGREKAEVSAEFDCTTLTDVRRMLEAQDLAGEPGECILRRVIEASGRSRAYINGRPCAIGQLRDIGELLIDIHGQHEHQSLMRPAAQRKLLDAYAGADAVAAQTAQSYRIWREAVDALERAQSSAAQIAQEKERLEWQAGELDQLNLGAHEWDELQSDHGRLANAQALIEGVENSTQALSESDEAVLAQVGVIAGKLRQLQQHDAALGEVLGTLDAAEIQLKEAAYALRHYRQKLDLDPARLKTVESRIDAVMTVSRKYRVQPSELNAKRQEVRARLQNLSASLDVESLQQAERTALESYTASAKQLTKLREKGAKSLAQHVTDSMQQLAMAGGRFEIALRALETPSAGGLEQVEFNVAPHKGGTAAPIAKIASGGELSRLSLAVQTVTSRVADIPTLIFDEVDSGIGGGVAEIVGRMLRALGTTHQVLCITHLPQVAASAEYQWRVTKREVNAQTLSSVTALAGDERVEEIARMLGGVKLTETTRKHAQEMLAGAAASVKKPARATKSR